MGDVSVGVLPRLAIDTTRTAAGTTRGAPLPWPKAKARRMTPLQQQKKREAALAEGQSTHLKYEYNYQNLD